ncbi:MAG: type II toxin-antitoxin system VapC family toxin [Deltaproteobacteria bacterium]|nr:type II toxin-antitoxin system VapC family toxin [Deltaproteobacteria bacterium]
MVVIDTSVALKWFLEEEGSDIALGLLAEEQFAAPDLLIYELTNGLVFKESFTLDDIADCLGKLMKFDIDFLVLTEKSMARTAELAREFHLSAYDASFIALAEYLKTDFVTADRKMAQKVKALPFVRSLAD